MVSLHFYLLMGPHNLLVVQQEIEHEFEEGRLTQVHTRLHVHNLLDLRLVVL